MEPAVVWSLLADRTKKRHAEAFSKITASFPYAAVIADTTVAATTK